MDLPSRANKMLKVTTPGTSGVHFFWRWNTRNSSLSPDAIRLKRYWRGPRPGEAATSTTFSVRSLRGLLQMLPPLMPLSKLLMNTDF